MMNIRVALAGALAFSFLAGGAFAQVSLWSGDGEQGVTRAVKARNFSVHDIIHVVVIVAAESATGEEADLEKKTTAKMSLDQYVKLQSNGLLLPDIKGESPDNLGFDSTSDKKFEGDGTAAREDTMRARLAAEIVEIKPNGNLVIEARSRYTKSREQTIITLTGIVRPQDIGTDNTVYSYDVADVDIKYESTGPVTDANRRGWFTKLLDAIWPF
jgi:flagellar L-ring protein precursor FlgH